MGGIVMTSLGRDEVPPECFSQIWRYFIAPAKAHS